MSDPQQLDMFAAPPSDTRREAYEAIQERSGRLCRLSLAAIEKSDGLTADECAAHLDESVLAIRPRITELKDAGLIKDSGKRRLNRSGKFATVWVAV